ncbi:MAG: response regulator transcription factor [Flavobacteriales bacterium]
MRSECLMQILTFIPMNDTHILIVDDEEDIRMLLTYNLEKEGFKVNAVANGKECLDFVAQQKPHLILLDVMMPQLDGIEVCERIKANPVNQDIIICFLTARNEDYSQIAGLDAGADDYIAKPIKTKVLLSRIQALLRRGKVIASPKEAAPKFHINREKYLLEMDGQEIHLPRKEFELLALLASRPNFVFKRDQILEKVWGTDIVVGDRTIDVHIRKLREKIGDDYISTIKGIGYKFNE